MIDDGAGAVARIGPRVEDVALVAGLGSRFLGVLAADEDAAVGIIADPELGVDLEVFVFFLRDQEGRGFGVLLILGYDRPVLDREIGVAVALPVIKVLAAPLIGRNAWRIEYLSSVARHQPMPSEF
jgi:hypothetical protein